MSSSYRSVRFWVPRLVRAALGLVVLVLGYCGLFAVIAGARDLPLDGAKPASGMKQPRGAYHVHTTNSDGRGTVEEVAREAARAGLQFVIVTDHNDPQDRPPERIAGVLVIHGVELSTSAGHLVALGARRAVTPDERRGPAVSLVNELGGTSILAHPLQDKRPWTDWDAAKSARGFELYSGDSMFRRALRSPLTVLLPAFGSYLGNRELAFIQLAERDLATEDALLALAAASPKLALCANDAHGLPAYREAFAGWSMVLPAATTLDGEVFGAQAAVLTALAHGDAYCAFPPLGDADGFSLTPNAPLHVGDRISVTLPAALPKSARIDVRGAGKRIDPNTIEATASGAMLVQVMVDAPARLYGTVERPWIVANPITVTP